MTTGQLHALLRRFCLETDPDQAAERYQEAVSERRVVMEPSVDGTAHLSGFDLAPDRAAAAEIRVALRLTRRAADSDLSLALD